MTRAREAAVRKPLVIGIAALALVLLSSSVRGGEPPHLAVGPGAPAVFHGEGTAEVGIAKEPGVGVVQFDCPQCTGNVVLRSDGQEGLLVNEIGPYRGKRWFDLHAGGRTTTLAVTATGRWTLTVGGTDLAGVRADHAAGAGDDVVFLTRPVRSAAVTHSGGGNFVVHAVELATGRVNLSVNRIGAFAGTVELRGPVLLQVRSSGPWSVRAS
ncbi:hypothetical protein NLX83_00010 [Allokutzneria sp. A3M-2-11 16]|uniref:hypothetical protein n=1 Tax=Allokutzneria sp. A3M-2-11 16 TaxID=2962043 RepID=UPI0020B8E9EA|nr:hypothetical protein [Allokutzneria sp. A3M-2-11 16]MCP3797631.1 hypothetical protein [Allokutzneria sp. A3M-2-11 16]